MQKQSVNKYEKRFNFKWLMVFAFACLLSTNLQAQVFDESLISDDTQDSESSITENQSTQRVNKQQPARKTVGRGVVRSPLNQKKAVVSKNVKVSEVKQLNQTDPDEKIYLYMRDFKISRDMHGRTSCDVSFYVYSTVNEKITNIAYRLKWPGMETPVSFNNVEPKKAIFVEYGLLGKGCYEMDATPNIIVNRCRIKGRTQESCSSMIQWSK